MKTSAFMVGLAFVGALPAAAQERTPAPTDGGFFLTVPADRRPPATLGLGLRARPRPAEEGPPRWADYPTVQSVAAGSPAALAGILPGDVILSANGFDGHELKAMLITAVGQRFELQIRRGSEVHDYTLTSVPNPPVQ